MRKKNVLTHFECNPYTICTWGSSLQAMRGGGVWQVIPSSVTNNIEKLSLLTQQKTVSIQVTDSHTKGKKL